MNVLKIFLKVGFFGGFFLMGDKSETIIFLLYLNSLEDPTVTEM